MYVLQETYCEQLCTLIEVFADPMAKWMTGLESDPRAKHRSDYQIELIREELLEKHRTIDGALFSNIR